MVMRNNFMVQTTVCVPLDIYKEIQKLTAIGKYRSKGEVLRQALVEFLKTENVRRALVEFDRVYGHGVETV